MRYIGIDLHKRVLVVAVEGGSGRRSPPTTFFCQDVDAIRTFCEAQRPFRAVIEASSSYRWLYELLAPLGEIVLAHPLRLRAIAAGRAKTDKLDAKLLARLLRGDLIPTAYVPPRSYHELRELTRARARLSRRTVETRNELHALLTRANLHAPYRNAFCRAGRQWLAHVELGMTGNLLRDELLRRLEYFENERLLLDRRLEATAVDFPQVAALLDLPGIGLYSALLVVAELGEPGRFREGRLVGAYAGLTPRVRQSGEHAYHGRISRQGSPWLRWILTQAAIHVVRHDPSLKAFYARIRKRSSARIARVAVARKLATICWVRLHRWHEQQAA